MITTENIIEILNAYDIALVNETVLPKTVASEFAYLPPIGETFCFIVMHDGSPESFILNYGRTYATLSVILRPRSRYRNKVIRHIGGAGKAITDAMMGKPFRTPKAIKGTTMFRDMIKEEQDI